MFVSRKWKKDLEKKSKRLAHLESKIRKPRDELCPVITPGLWLISPVIKTVSLFHLGF